MVFLPTLLEWPPNAQLLIDTVEESTELSQVTKDIYALILPQSLYDFIYENEEEEIKGVKKNIILSLGVFALVLIFLTLLLILYCILNSFNKRGRRCCMSLHQVLRKNLFYDSFIRWMIEANFGMAYENIAFVLMYANYDTQADAINTCVRFFFIGLVSFWLIFSFTFILCRFSVLE